MCGLERTGLLEQLDAIHNLAGGVGDSHIRPLPLPTAVPELTVSAVLNIRADLNFMWCRWEKRCTFPVSFGCLTYLMLSG